MGTEQGWQNNASHHHCHISLIVFVVLNRPLCDKEATSRKRIQEKKKDDNTPVGIRQEYGKTKNKK
jgi:hypothetical protein